MIRQGIAVVLLLLPGVARADSPDLYSSRTIVTGSDLRSRPEGMAQCLRDVLVKVSGDLALRDDARIGALAARADAYVSDFAYEDRMWSVPMKDEQGSRDRPYDLTVHFVPARIDAALRSLGVPPWRAPRPPLLIDIVIERDGARFPLTADGAPDERAREAALDAAERYAMRLVLKPTNGAAVSGKTEDESAVRLSGSLRWDHAAVGWVGEWGVDWGGAKRSWGIGGVSLDEAFRNAVGGAMQVVSGHSAPTGR
jgi:hypothetical protein